MVKNPKTSLIKELDEIVELTTKQNYHYVRGRAYLYEGFAAVYLWWLKAKAVDGFLEEQYQLHKIGGKEHELNSPGFRGGWLV
jgi:hypothetical protein